MLLLLVVAAVIGYILVDHDAGLYRDMTVVKITDISTKHTETQTGVLSDKENYYVQTITANILNGEYKGKTATLSNQYTDSNVRDEAYAVGDQLLVDLARDGTTGKILEQKRDTLVYLLVAVLLIGLIAVADRAGFFSFLSVCINLVLLLFALRCGANLIDVMGDLYCKDPRELTCDPAAVEKQKRLIDEIHERGGEVLISSHLFRYAPTEEVLEIALAQQERGADVVKIVCAADSEEQELEALRIITLLRQALRVPFLFLVGGSHCRLVRHIGPMLGCCMWLTVPAHDALSTKVQPVCRAIRAIADNFDYAPDRTFDE